VKSEACGTHGEEKNVTLLWISLKKRYHLEGHGVDGMIILKCIALKLYKISWTGITWLRMEKTAGCC
jgi:hypothetical protein